MFIECCINFQIQVTSSVLVGLPLAVSGKWTFPDKNYQKQKLAHFTVQIHPNTPRTQSSKIKIPGLFTKMLQKSESLLLK